MPKKKIEPSEYPNILELYKGGLSPEKIGKQYNVGRTSIIYILNKYYKKDFDEIRLKDRNVKVYFAKESITKTFNFKNKFNLVNIAIVIIVLIISQYVFSSNTIAETFYKNIYPFLTFIFFLIIPLIILMIVKIKKTT